MFNISIIIFIAGWALWFFIDKHPFSLGARVPEEMDAMLDNFQVAFDMLAAGFIRAAYVFIWKAHYIIITIVVALLVSAIYGGVTNVMRRRALRKVMYSNIKPVDKNED